MNDKARQRNVSLINFSKPRKMFSYSLLVKIKIISKVKSGGLNVTNLQLKGFDMFI